MWVMTCHTCVSHITALFSRLQAVALATQEAAVGFPVFVLGYRQGWWARGAVTSPCRRQRCPSLRSALRNFDEGGHAAVKTFEVLVNVGNSI